MAETPKAVEQTPAEHARAVASDLLKEHLTPQGSLDLAKFHSALLKHAESESKRISAAGSSNLSRLDGCIKDTSINGMTTLYYTAADEVLGIIPREKWQTGQTLACDIRTSVRDWWHAKPPSAEVVNNYGLECKPSDNPQVSITNVLSCEVPPIPASLRSATTPDKGRG